MISLFYAELETEEHVYRRVMNLWNQSYSETADAMLTTAAWTI